LSPAFSLSAAYQLQDTHLFDVNVPPEELPLIDARSRSAAVRLVLELLRHA
jgi:hypothetical protein